MRTLRSIISGLLTTITILFVFTNGYAAVGTGGDTGTTTAPTPTVTLHAASRAVIPFRNQGSSRVEGLPLEARDVPHLVLRRNGALTDAVERTLVVEVTGIQVPPPGVTVTLTVETQRGDPDADEGDFSRRAKEPRVPSIGRADERRIRVWHETRWIVNRTGATRMRARAVFEQTFGETTVSETGTIATPTDYFRYDVAVTRPPVAPGDRRPAPLHLIGNHAFLMENQWIAPLPAVKEASTGAAPEELIVYYADMFPFQRDPRDPATWLAREDVPYYVRAELVPRMVAAFRVQTDQWGFPWYDAWTSYRPGVDAERLSVALSDGQTWFHGKAPLRGDSSISINVSGGDNTHYDTLTDGLMSAFHHELFHNHQRNISQNEKSRGAIGGAEGAWQFFSEGTAVLASSVGQPGLQFAPVPRAYVSRANNFLGEQRPVSDLNASYEEMTPYNAAIYWRFLYEQCGRAPNGNLDPAAGMDVIRRALTILYSGDVVDVTASTDLVAALPEILDRALSGSSCPLNTYTESLTAFARAIYALRLDGGRCATPGIPAGCGFYDPHMVYRTPPIETATYVATDQQMTGAIPSSFGIDFIHTTVDQAVDGRSLALEFRQPAGVSARFSVQVVGTAKRDTLGLIITRVDANERTDPVGEYTIVLRSTEPTGPACTPLSPTHC